MIVAIRTAEILALFGLLGLPLNLLLLPRAPGSLRRLRISPRLLLAPVTGLAVFAVYTAAFFALRQPVATASTFFWPLLAGLWVAVTAGLWRFTPGSFPRAAFPAWSGRAWLAHGLIVPGLLLVLGLYLWPFFQNPALVFWHYAGSDGYFYIRIAEHVAHPGTGVIPTVGPYDASSGFLAAELRLFQIGTFIDKPGTMSTLGGLAGVLRLTTHETFSPLVVAGVAMLYLVLVVFGQSLLKLPVWASVAFACLGALAPPVWMISSHTFLGNLLALPLYPLIMLMVVRPAGPWRAAVYVGLLWSAQLVVFPDGTLALAGMLAIMVLWHAWTAMRRHRLPQFFRTGLVAAGTAVILVLPFGLVLYVTAGWRLRQVLSTASRTLFDHPQALQHATERAAVTRLVNLDWMWGAFNLNTIPPRPLQAGEVPYLYGLAAGLGLFVLASIGRRHLTRLFPYLIGFLLLLAAGLAGLFQSAYELFRALAVFAFVPVAALCTLPWLVAGSSRGWRPSLLRFVFLALLVPLLGHFIRTDWYHFKLGYDQHMPDAQYTAGNFGDREAIGRLGQSHSLILTSENASFTAFANTLMLFSQVKLGVPSCFNRFIYFGDGGLKAAPYDAGLVVRNLRYIDITAWDPGARRYYASRDFEVVENDLEPFFDNDTLPLVNGFPVEFLRQRQLSLTRTLSERTIIPFYSRVRRWMIVELQFIPGDRPTDLTYALDDAPPQPAQLDQDGTVLLPMTIEPGLHQLTLGPLQHPAQLKRFGLHAHGAGLPPAYFKDRWYDTRDLQPAQLAPFQFMTPQPVRFYSLIGPALYEKNYFAHPVTRLRFQVPAGHRTLRTVVHFDPGAYEKVTPGDATDGIELQLALVTSGGQRSVVAERIIDPTHNPADRGSLLIEMACDVPAGSELELFVGPGKAGRNNRDWFYVGPLTIR
jgi:hypothetical protein